MKLVKVEIELVIDDEVCESSKTYSHKDSYKDCIAFYLTSKLYEDPEFFGDFGPENITTIQEFE